MSTGMETKELISHLRKMGRGNDSNPNYYLEAADCLTHLERQNKDLLCQIATECTECGCNLLHDTTELRADLEKANAEIERIKGNLKAIVAERDAAITFINYLDVQYGRYLGLGENERFAQWRKREER